MTRRMPPLKQLHAFEAAARHQSFKLAAEELHVTQAAVSHQVRALEEHMGQQLFVRKTRQVVLTPQAKGFAEALAQAFDTIAEAAHRMEDVPMEGELKLSVAPFFANRLLLPRLARFAEKFPKIAVRPFMSSTYVDPVDEGFDGLIRYGGGTWDGLTALRLYDDCVTPVAAPSYITERTLPMSPEDIARTVMSSNSQNRRDWSNWFAAVGYTPDFEMTVIDYPDRARAIDLAISGGGVALTDLHIIAPDLASGALIQLHPVAVPSEKNMYLAFPETGRPDPRLMAFFDWFRQDLLAMEADFTPAG